MFGSSRVGGTPSSSNPPPHQATQQGQPTAPPPFERTFPGPNANAGDNSEPSAKRSRRTGTFGASAQPTVTLPSNPTAPVTSNRQLVRQRVLNHMQLPTQAQTPPVDFTLSSGEVGMRGMAAAGSQGGQATSARTQAPSRQRRQTTTQTPAPRLAGPAATPSSSDTLLRTLLARPMMPPSNPSSAASTIAPSVPRPLAPAGMLQRTTQAPTTRSSMATPASGNDHQLIHMLAQPYVDAELTHLRSVPPSSLTSTVASPVATPLPSAQGTQGTPFVPGPPVHVASAATAQPTLSAAPSTFPPFSSLGLTVEDLNQRDMMDEYLQGAPMGRIPVSTAPNPPQNFPLPGQMQATPMPTLVPAGIANVAQHPPGI